ncbi:hypothetical protein CH359_07825 [Leptospira meyeri]|nr:hypothetical protein CH359_07825 [Leptospira meyeri]PJZ97360.1 hypothetical protein CH358_09495 [Leptospira meyeri]PKA11692.1 hypothetical protein CH372_12890 [Leptospira meyeri]PKA22633.1 hypothetical protein CH381_29930 [Leptospira sp. mixed culture ATI2-C-A1]
MPFLLCELVVQVVYQVGGNSTGLSEKKRETLYLNGFFRKKNKFLINKRTKRKANESRFRF